MPKTQCQQFLQVSKLRLGIMLTLTLYLILFVSFLQIPLSKHAFADQYEDNASNSLENAEDSVADSEALPTNAATATDDFKNWLLQFSHEAEAAGINSKTIDEFINNAQFLEKVIILDQKQPEKTRNFNNYLKAALPKSKITLANKKYKENKILLDKIGKKYGVQPRFIVALWGTETYFGRNMGNFKVLDALASLAFEGRRADFFKAELINALKIIDRQHIKKEEMLGSWAGAMGQTQFMPSSYLEMAVDYDKDGKIDIWHSKADSFASIANYLKQNGWDNSSNWGREVTLPADFDTSLIGKEISRPIKVWHDLGVKNIDGKPLKIKKGLEASIIKASEQDSPRVFLVYPNYKILLKWNRSLYFATSVGFFADRIKP